MRFRLTNGLLSALACLLIAWSLGMPLLGVCGTQVIGQITTVRKQGGERNESVAGRYTYAIGYQFQLPDGRTVAGATTHVGNYYQVYDLPAAAAAPIRYCSWLPAVNALEVDTRPGLEQAIVLLVGALLLSRHRLSHPQSARQKVGRKKQDE